MIQDFDKRLRACMKAGRLTNSDMSAWFGKSVSSTRKWMQGVKPYAVYEEELIFRLEKLEKLIQDFKGEPIIPHEILQTKRRRYLLDLFDR